MERDEAVRDSQPTVEYVGVGSTLPTDLAGILQGMSSKVSAEIVEVEEQEQNRCDRNRSRESQSDRRRRSDG